jgi:iron complex outermembrane recepter protein
MFAVRRINKACALALGGTMTTALFVAVPARAQAADATGVKSYLVEVTGSSIKRIAGETALPVQVLTRSDIERSGVSTAEQLLATVSATSSAGAMTVAGSGPGGGQSGFGSVSLVSLRGLGAQRTLVLINGRRSAPAGGSSAVDIGTIPLAAIERVEVLKDGASAIYGSDAIAGVVNFILRKDFQGTEVTATLGSPTRSGGGQESRVSLFTGFGDYDTKGYTATLSASVQHIKPIFGASRPFSSFLNTEHYLDKTSGISFPANVVTPAGTLANPVYPDCGPYSLVSPLTPGVCRYDYSPAIALQPETKVGNVALSASFNVSPAVEAYVNASLTHSQTNNTIQPNLVAPTGLPASSPYVATLTNFLAQYPQFAKPGNYIGTAAGFLPPTSPYYPAAFAASIGAAGQPLPLYLRTVENGPRQTQDTSDSARLVLGARGNLGAWDYDSGILYSQDKITERLTGGWEQTNAYLTLLDSGVLNPFGPTTDAAARQAALDTNYNGTWYVDKTSIASVDAKVSRDLYKLPAGMIGLALGTELRRESMDLAPSDANQQDLVMGWGGLGGVPVSAKRNVASAYAEVNVPILKTLEADAAVRYDKYQRVGSTVNPKASFRWQPIEKFLVRGSWGSGFRAPTLADLYTPQSISGVTTNGQVDSKLCPDPTAPGAGANPDCNAQYNLIQGGNPDLKPEKSESVTLGFLVEPNKDYSLGLDLFHVTVKDTIVSGAASYQTILADEARFGNLILRGPDGRITAINQGNTNLGKSIVAGVDVDLKARVLDSGGQRVTLRMNGTYMSKFDRQNLDGSYSSAINNPSSAGTIGVVMRWRDVASATWEVGDWSTTLAWNYQNPYHDVHANKEPAAVKALPARDVASYSTLDAQVSYSGFKATKLTLGAKNLADSDPPYTNYGGGFVGSYDLSYADVRGRFVYLTASHKF